MPIGVNLLPWRARQARQQRWRLARIGLGSTLVGLLAMMLAAGGIDERNTAARARQADLDARLTALAPAIEARRRLDRVRAALERRYTVVEDLGTRRTRATDALTQALEARPAAITLTRLRLRADERVIQGHARQADAVPRLIDALRRAPAFTGLQLQRLAHPADAPDPDRGRGFRLVLTHPPATDAGNAR
jgi:Tfp pilus assembly protein PilN